MARGGKNPQKNVEKRCKIWENKREHMFLFLILHKLAEGSLEIKLPTIWTDEKHVKGHRREESRKKIKKEKVSEERRSRCAKR